jgi:hypothetical protein
VADKVISKQREALAINTRGKGFGPQSLRDIDSIAGNNPRAFNAAPASTKMNLCNIHFYKYSGKLSAFELESTGHDICPGEHGALNTGDTIEVHYVYSTAKIEPGPNLGACLSDAIKNPQLRVETQIYVLVNDSNALDFGGLSEHKKLNGLHQATNIPSNTGTAIQYAGSTTGPSYNEKGSPFQVSWSVRPNVAKVNIESVGKWCESNTFNEDHAQGVRNLVTNPDLISKISH